MKKRIRGMILFLLVIIVLVVSYLFFNRRTPETSQHVLPQKTKTQTQETRKPKPTIQKQKKEKEKKDIRISSIDSNTGQVISLDDKVGLIQIPKLNITLPILEGTSENELMNGIGHMPETSLPGDPDGNAGLAGHRDCVRVEYFNNLDQVEMNDTIYVMTKDKKMEFKVFDKLIVYPEDVYVLDPQKDKSIITLITCHPKFDGSQRLIIHAALFDAQRINRGKHRELAY